MGPFATAAEFCEWTGLPVPSDLARVQALLDSASAMIRGATGQTLSIVAGDTAILGPTGTFWLFLPQAPVTAITSITVDAVVLSPTKYVFTELGQVTRTDSQVWSDDATIVYDHGYAETTEEFKRIRTVCIEAVKRAY